MKENLSAGLVDRLLQFVRWVDTWKKLLILLLLAAGLAAGAVAWEYRSRLLEPVIRAVRGPVIEQDRLEAEMNAVMRDTDAIALVVWSVSIERNYRETLYVRINEEKVPRLEGDGDIVLRLHVRETTEIIRLLNTSAACWPYAGATKIGMEAARAGVKWVCAVKVPPSYGRITGIIAVGFTHQPDNEDFIKVRIILGAEKIIK